MKLLCGVGRVIMNSKLAIGFVIYKPDSKVLTRLECIISLGFHLFLYDNSPKDGMVRSHCEKYSTLKQISYLTCGKNVGLGYGLSAVCAQAYYEGYLALLFFDQDTIFSAETLMYVEGLYVGNRDMWNDYISITFNSNTRDVSFSPPPGNGLSVKEVFLTINSGSLFSLGNLCKMNWHAINYFVDCVDYELCLRANNMNLKIGLCTSAPGIDHKSEQGDIVCKIWGRDRYMRRYSTGRILGTVQSCSRLLLESVKTFNAKYLFLLAKSLAGYVFWQVAVRLLAKRFCKKRIEA